MEIYVQHDGLRVSLEETEAMWVGHRRKELEIHLDGKKLSNETVLYTWLEQYVGMDIKICRRNAAGVNTLRKISGMMGDRWISHKLKGKPPTSCISPPYLCGLETIEFVLKSCQRWRRY